MSLFDKIAAAVTPPESDEARAEARRKAEQLAGEYPFIATVLEHHHLIEQGFADTFAAGDAQARTAALKQLGVVITGHANAEESVLYPAMADNDEKGHAGMAYQEQAMVKVEMAKMEMLDPMSQEWSDKLEHIQGAVAHHMYEEEGTWFPELAEAVPPAMREKIGARFREEFERYVGGEGAARVTAPPKAPELA